MKDKTLKDIPPGKWKHLGKSMEWEAFNKNTAKGLVGTFKKDGHYLRWESQDAQENLFIEVAEADMGDKKLWIKHRSGLQYWFERVGEKDGLRKKGTA